MYLPHPISSHNFTLFEVNEFNPLICDVHALISFEVIAKHENDESTENMFVPRIKWDPTRTATFQKMVEQANFKKIQEKLDNFQSDPSQNTMDGIVYEINDIFENAKTKTFPLKPCKFVKKKAWYDGQLDNAKRKFSAARKGKNSDVKRAHTKYYKKLLASKFKSHGFKTAEVFRSLKPKDPKKFYKLLRNSAKPTKSTKISAIEFEQHF